jgi:hypothetical protein
MIERGLPETEAQDEIARAYLGCMWEVWKGQPDRFSAVLGKLREGRSAAELFPDELYAGETAGSA